MSGVEGLDRYTANVVQGDGAVVRWPSGVVLAGGEGTAGLDLIARLTAVVGDEPTAGALMDALGSDGDVIPPGASLVAAVTTQNGARVFVRGGAQARTDTNELISGDSPIERDLDTPAALWLGLGDPPTVQGHPAKNLRLGVVSGSGVVLYLSPKVAPVAPAVQAQQPAAPTPPAPPVPSPVSAPAPPAAPSSPAGGHGSPAGQESVEPRVIEGDFKAIDWDGPTPAETREPLAIVEQIEDADGVPVSSTGEQVLGIRCSRNHFNNPKAGYCQVCGISMVHLTHRLEPGARPTLGFMVFADGATYAVDRQYLIGRSPEPGAGGGFTPLQTQDATQSVSREHAELRLDGWDVYYADLGSTNGSFLWDANARRWDPIQPNSPVQLTSGTTVSVGRMTFVFEAASRAIESP